MIEIYIILISILVSYIFVLKGLHNTNKYITKQLDDINKKLVSMRDDNMVIRKRTLKSELYLEGLHLKIDNIKSKKKK